MIERIIVWNFNCTPFLKNIKSFYELKRVERGLTDNLQFQASKRFLKRWQKNTDALYLTDAGKLYQILHE
jgi:hypothetical protein